MIITSDKTPPQPVIILFRAESCRVRVDINPNSLGISRFSCILAGDLIERCAVRRKPLVFHIAIVFSLEWLPGTQVHFFHLVSEYKRHSDPFHPLKLCQQGIFSSLGFRVPVFTERTRHPRRYFATSLDIRVHVFRFCRGALISNTSVDRTIFPQGSGTLSFPHVILHPFRAFFGLHCRYTSGCNRHASCIWREGNCHLQSPACSPCAVCMSNFRANSRRARFVHYVFFLTLSQLT